jgi:hypothetical protein
MAFWKYFDLNGRVGSSPRGVVDRSSDPLETKKPIHQDRPKGVSPKDEEEFETSGIRVSNQTDTQSSRLKVGEEQQEKPSSTTPVAMPLWEQIVLYAGLVVGVLFSSAVMQWKAGNAANVAFTFTGVALSIVIAFILLPVVREAKRECKVPSTGQIWLGDATRCLLAGLIGCNWKGVWRVMSATCF